MNKRNTDMLAAPQSEKGRAARRAPPSLRTLAGLFMLACYN